MIGLQWKSHQVRLLFLAALSGLLLSCAWPPFNFSPAAWIALLPLGVAVQRATSIQTALIAGSVTGIIWAVPVFDWIRTCGNAHSISALGPLWLPWAAGIVGTAVSMSVMTLSCFVLINRLQFPACAALPIAWILFEETCAVVSALLLGTSSDFMRLAVTQVRFPLFLQVADLGGSLLVGWIVASISGLFTVALARRPKSVMYSGSFVLAAVQIAAAAFYGICSLSTECDKSSTAAIVPRMVSETLTSATELPAEVIQAEFIVFPEGSIDGVFPIDPHVSSCLSEVRSVFAGANVIVGVHRIDTETAQRFNSALLIASDEQTAQAADKRYLTPGFEFTPFVAELCGIQFGTSDTLISGDGPQCFQTGNGTRVGVGICHDVAFAAWAADIVTSGVPDFFVTIGNEGLDSSDFGQQMLLQCAALRAVESRRAIVRSVAHGYSAVIDANGVVCLATTHRGGSAIVGRIPLDKRTGWFAAYRNLLPWTLISVVAATAGLENCLSWMRSKTP